MDPEAKRINRPSNINYLFPFFIVTSDDGKLRKNGGGGSGGGAQKNTKEKQISAGLLAFTRLFEISYTIKSEAKAKGQ